MTFFFFVSKKKNKENLDEDSITTSILSPYRTPPWQGGDETHS
jgi:hypothetical protein